MPCRLRRKSAQRRAKAALQDASINSANSGNYGNNTAGDPGSGYTNANGVGQYEFVRATNTVPLAGGTVNIVGGGGGGLLNAYNMTAVVGQGQRTFQVVRVPQYGSVSLTSGLTALAWNGSTGGILSLDAADILSLTTAQ